MAVANGGYGLPVPVAKLFIKWVAANNTSLELIDKYNDET